jgi:outer membrane receptor protein involved in Fe transport
MTSCLRGCVLPPLFLLLTLLLPVRSVWAQGAPDGVTVSGRVVDGDTRESVAYLTVQLLWEQDSAFVAGRLTNESGAFVFTGLRRGSYLVVARRIGYRPVRVPVLVGELSAFLDLGALPLKRDAQRLSGLRVADQVDGVNAAMDRKTFSVGDNVSQTGGSVLQAMSTIPGVTMQDGKLLLRGSDKVVVLIDGKQTALTGYGSQSGLDNLPASSLERIEIIDNPSSRYDANGSAGIINLVFRQQKRDGWSGKVGLVGGAGALWERRENLPTIRPQFRRTPKVNPSIALNYREGATNAFLQADWLYSPTLNKNEFGTRTYDDGRVILQQVKRNRRTDYTTVSTGIDHAFDTRNSLTVSGLFNREKIIDRGDNPYFDGTLQNRMRLWQFLEDEVKYTGLGTAVFTHRFMQPGHSVALTGNYSFHREDERYSFTNVLPSFTGSDAFKLLSDEHVVDVNADYVRPLRQGRIEAGFKGRYRSIPVDMQFFPGQNSPIDSGAGGWATYREVIPALYGTYVYEGRHLEVESGVRVEQVAVDYDVNPDHNTYRSDGYRYFEPFPTLRLGYRMGESSKLSLFYNRRVDRPNEVDIRIFPKYDEPELIKVGNPALQPQFSTSYELGLKHNVAAGSLYAAVFHRYVDGTISRIATRVPGSLLLYNVFQNVGRSRSTGAEVTWQHPVSSSLTLNANASAYQRSFDAFTVVNRYPVPSSYPAPRERLASGSAKLTAQLRLPNGWQTQVASVYYAPDLLPQGRIDRRIGVDVGTKKSVQNGRGEIVLNATDLFSTMQAERTIRGSDFRFVSTDFLETQVVRGGYSWKF